MRSGWLVRAALLAALMSPLCFAQPACSLNTVAGVWAEYTQGVIVMQLPGAPQPAPVPAAQITRLTIGFDGQVAGSGIASVGGQGIEGSFAGTLEVSADCTAVMRVRLHPNGAPDPLPTQAVIRLIILDHGNDMHGIVVQGALGVPIGTDHYRRLSRALTGPACTLQTLRGTYEYDAGGVILVPGAPMPVPAALVGTISTDGAGGMAGSLIGSVGGRVVSFTGTDGSITVNPDCTGATSWRLIPAGGTDPLPGAGGDRFIILDGGNEAIVLTPQGPLGAPVMLGTLRRISPVAFEIEW